MKILITGAYGQLGNELADILKKGKSEIGAISEQYQGAEVVAVDMDRLDISDDAQVQAFVSEVKPDVIFNCAAMTNVDACETAFETAMKANAIGPRNMAAAAEKAGAKLIHVSTDYVFRGDAKTPYCEWDECAPNTVYGKSKLLGERYVAAFSTRYFIVRTSWLYGYVGNNFVKTMRRLGKSKEAISVVSDQRGNPTNANDLAHHLLAIALTQEYGIYHCTGEGECSWYDFASKIMALSGLSCSVNPCTTEQFAQQTAQATPRPAFSSLNNLMLKSTVGNEMRSWEPALATYIEKLEKMENEQV